ncbi:MAG: universal stress protein, partial [Pseudaminobacter sp.]
GRPDKVVLDVASETGCNLIVTGIAGNDPIGQPLLGSTTVKLARHAAVPVLVVKMRPRMPYSRVVVASDLSDASLSAMRLALGIFRPEQLILFHTFDMPFRSWTGDKAGRESSLRAQAQSQCAAFLEAVAGADAARIAVIAARGDPAVTIADFAADEDVDLVVAGTHGHTGLMDVLLGSVAVNLLDEVPCDMLIVPAIGARAGD